MGLTALDLGLRGAASGVFLMMVLVLSRLRPLNKHVLLGLAMSAGGAAFAIATAPFIPKSSLWWTMPILSAQPVVIWLWAHITFDDDFVPAPWHGAFWLATVGIGFVVSLTWTSFPAAAHRGANLLAAIAVGLMLAAAVQMVRTWRADLVTQRRRLRTAALVINFVFVVLIAGSSLAPEPITGVGISGSLAIAGGLFMLAMLGGFGLFSAQMTAAARDATAVIAPPDAVGEAAAVTSDAADRASIAPALLRRLEKLMTVERVYRQEGLSIGRLAALLDLPEYRLREAINEGLGYRNFNAFLNSYRIEDAKTALSDQSQRDVPILTIAMDAGFQSIGPFNRAFKAATGMTPTEFRRDAQATDAESEADRIAQSRHGFG
ncbi:transcriptional regulator [Bradyrhizobium iriomotense]|uniref:Transcriptional regulator n=2 Tax=Bradyrhizobium iriomotense TaxID=441950 RepID=A0ABQ6ATZ0_9BRAD|nr:transcriptional regulator [Bradyrhizobium iriomotense]